VSLRSRNDVFRHVAYRRCAYAPFAFLHISVLLRIVADLFEWIDLRTFSGPMTAVALASYAGTLIVASRKNNPPAGHGPRARHLNRPILAPSSRSAKPAWKASNAAASSDRDHDPYEAANCHGSHRSRLECAAKQNMHS
jgi:hypothetical protein